MVTIYVLINPFNNEPFYVGSTVNVMARLYAHKRCHEGTSEKKQLIDLINKPGLKMEILPLLVCSEKAASKCEAEIYGLLISNGYTLYNDRYRLNIRQNYSHPDHYINQPMRHYHLRQAILKEYANK